MADDVVTETEAGPLEESDLDAEARAGDDDVIDADAVVTETEAGPLEVDDRRRRRRGRRCSRYR